MTKLCAHMIHYMDFYFHPIIFLYLFSGGEESGRFLQQLKFYADSHFPEVTIHGVYVNCTLLLFFKEFAGNYQDMSHFFSSIKFPGRSPSLETEDQSFKNLQNLLETILDKIKRFSMIYYINDFRILSSCNYSCIMMMRKSK